MERVLLRSVIRLQNQDCDKNEEILDDPTGIRNYWVRTRKILNCLNRQRAFIPVSGQNMEGRKYTTALGPRTNNKYI